MRKLNKALIPILVIGLMLTGVHIISAQRQRGGGAPGGTEGRPRFDPEQMLQRRVENIMEGMQEMNIPDNEAVILKTQIEGLLRLRMTPNDKMTQAMETLQKAVDSKDNEQIRTALDSVKAMRKEQKTKLEDAEKQLLEILPLKVEALLTVQGIVNGGTGGGMMNFGGRRRGGTGNQRTQRRQRQ